MEEKVNGPGPRGGKIVVRAPFIVNEEACAKAFCRFVKEVLGDGVSAVRESLSLGRRGRRDGGAGVEGVGVVALALIDIVLGLLEKTNIDLVFLTPCNSRIQLGGAVNAAGVEMEGERRGGREEEGGRR